MKTLTLVILLMSSVAGVLACSCMNPPTYCETVQGEPGDLVVLAYKFEDHYHGMKVKVVQVLDGTDNRDTLTVWGDMGMLCRWYCGAFNMGDTLILALHNCDTLGNMLGGSTLEKPEDYHISICGVYWLEYDNGQVTGPIDNGITSLGLNEFQQLNASCTPPTGIEESEPSFALYPNPTSGILNIEGAKGPIDIYDMYGQRLMSTMEYPLDISKLTKGVYFIKGKDINDNPLSTQVILK